MPLIAAGCQTMIVGARSRRAAAKSAFQSRPGARRPNSSRVHGLFAFATSTDSVRVACALAMRRSRSTMRARARVGVCRCRRASARSRRDRGTPRGCRPSAARLDVVVAIGQSEPALQQIRHVVRRVVQVLRDPDAEQIDRYESSSCSADRRRRAGADRSTSASARLSAMPSMACNAVAQRVEPLRFRSPVRPCRWRSSRRSCARPILPARCRRPLRSSSSRGALLRAIEEHRPDAVAAAIRRNLRSSSTSSPFA